MMGEDGIQSADLTGKRCTKKVTPAEGAISWDTVADAGEVDQDEEDQDNPNRGPTNKNVNIFLKSRIEHFPPGQFDGKTQSLCATILLHN